jgi:solute carrier family 25 phosphate transporter 23/24/25/41
VRAQAGITSVCSTYPLDLVRSRLSLATAALSSAGGGAPAFTRAELTMWGMISKVFREEGGVRGACCRDCGCTRRG